MSRSDAKHEARDDGDMTVSEVGNELLSVFPFLFLFSSFFFGGGGAWGGPPFFFFGGGGGHWGLVCPKLGDPERTLCVFFNDAGSGQSALVLGLFPDETLVMLGYLRLLG